MQLPFQPMPLRKRRVPFDDPDFIFEIKWDGFRALAVIEHGRTHLLSRNGHPFASFSVLADSIADALPDKQKYAPYVTDREASTWFKIRNPHYSQWAGREELFERERQREPVAGWHACALACAELEKTQSLRMLR